MKKFAFIFIALLCSSAFAADLPRIAVYVTGDVSNNEKEALGTRMLASLVNSGRYIAIERSNSFLAEIEREHLKQRSGDIDDSQISVLGKQFGVKFVCIAAITPIYGAFQVSARIVNVETAEVVFIGDASSPLKTVENLEQASDKVVENMFGGKTVSARKPEPQPMSTDTSISPIENTIKKNFSMGVRYGYERGTNIDIQMTLITHIKKKHGRWKKRRTDIMLGYLGYELEYNYGPPVWSSNFDMFISRGWPIDITRSGALSTYINYAFGGYIGDDFDIGVGCNTGLEYSVGNFVFGVDLRPMFYLVPSSIIVGVGNGINARYRF